MTAHLRVCDGGRIGVTCGVAQVHAYQWHIVGVARLDVGEMAVVVKQWARFSVGEETALESGKVGALLRRWLRRRLRRRLWLRWRGGFFSEEKKPHGAGNPVCLEFSRRQENVFFGDPWCPFYQTGPLPETLEKLAGNGLFRGPTQDELDSPHVCGTSQQGPPHATGTPNSISPYIERTNLDRRRSACSQGDDNGQFNPRR